ncbi:MAG: ATP-binding protein [Acidobacteriota bacterium]
MKERFSLGVRLMLVLVALAGLFAIVVLMTYRDQQEVLDEVATNLQQQRVSYKASVDRWYDTVSREHARQLAAPVLWGVDTLEGVKEGTAEFKKLQRRMWQFVYGTDAPPLWTDAPAGPLESVVVIDRNHRIVAASDPMVVDQQFTDPLEVSWLDESLLSPKVRRIDGRDDGRPVMELTTAVPNARNELIGLVRLRYVSAEISAPPELPAPVLVAKPHLIGPALAGLVAVLGVGFGAFAAWQVLTLTRRMETLAQGVRLPPSSGPGETALRVIEDKLGELSAAARRDDLLLDSLSEALREGVVLLDPTGSPVMVTHQALDVLRPGASDDEQSSVVRELLETNAELKSIVEDGLQRGIAVRERGLTLPGASGPRHVQVTSYVMQDGAKPAGIMLILKDRGSIAAFERNLKEASRLAAIGVLTRSIAHEVKNPLGAMGVHLEQLRRRLARVEADPTTEERIRVIREEIDRLHEILREWLGLTAPEDQTAGEAGVEEVLDSVARLLRVEARHQNVELIVERAGELGAVPLAPTGLRQVLLNLALNALQAMPLGGQLQLSAHREGDRLVLDVRDSGVGIPDAIRERIFDFHFTTRSDGSGLGLPICKRLVEAAGGTISFESSPGAGTVFRIQLPTRASLRQAEEAV